MDTESSAGPPRAAAKQAWSGRALLDRRLIEAALGGQASAYEQLFARYYQPVYQTILKMVRQPADADDLTLHTFAKAFRHLPSYRPQFAFRTWLFRIAANASIDFRRRQRQATLLLLPAPRGNSQQPWEVCDPAPTPQELLIRQQRVEVARQVVALLPPRYARLVRLRYFEELSYEEVASQLHLPLGTVKALLFRARHRLLELLRKSESAL